MSKIGLKPVSISSQVKALHEGGKMKISGPKGELIVALPSEIKAEIKEGKVFFTREGNDKKVKALHGLIRALVANAIKGVTEGFKKTLELIGVGYQASLQGQDLVLNVGFVNAVKIKAPTGITFQVEKNKIHVLGIDRKTVGEIAANIRKVRPPDAYKGKGIRYKDEVVRKKPGKAAKGLGTGASGQTL